MATGDVLWKVTGSHVTEKDWSTPQQYVAKQTVEFNNWKLAVPASTTEVTYTASGPLTVTTTYTHGNDGIYTLGEVAFDYNKTYTITITEE